MSGWNIRGSSLPIAERTHVMGILNVTPDSFSDGGSWTDTEIAIKHALTMIDEGADIIDVGGESTRPGADPVDAEIEIARVVPVIEGISATSDIPISIDTSKSEVARAAIEAGAAIVNDVTALGADVNMAEVVASSDVGLVLMHMLGEPRTMQSDPRYDDVVAEVGDFLSERSELATKAGIPPDRIVVDPGIGFGKTLDHNLELLRSIDQIRTRVGLPVLLGPSRKSFIGAVLDLEVDQRLEGTAAVIALAVSAGVEIVRVHDVTEMVRVVRMTEAVIGR